MTSNNSPDFDWEAAQADLASTDNVADLDAERDRRRPPADAPEPTDDLTDADAVEDGTPVLVDSPAAQHRPRISLAGLRMGERIPILPAWAKSAAEAKTTALWLAGLTLHTSGYHAVRVPKYGLKLAARSPRGFFKVTGGFIRWVTDWEGERVREATVRTEDAETYLKLSRQRDRRVRWRGMVAVAVAAGVVAAGITLAVASPATRWATLAAAVAALGFIGRPADKPLLDTAVVVPRVARLTSDVVVRALSVLGIGGINQALGKNSRAVSFPSPITRDGPGWRADVDLPYGVTAAEVMERRDKLASGLGRPLGCVWPEGNHDISPGRLTIWVGDQNMATAKPLIWPLAKSGTVDLFKPFPFGTDPRGRQVTMELMYTNLLIGSIPGVGKTFSLRVALLAAALDPRAELRVFELKGTGDLECMAKVATVYASGADDDVIELALIALRDLRAECSKRAAIIKGLPKSVCPENKVTPELASRKGLGLHPLVVAFDECQELFSHAEFGKEAGELAEKIVKLGRALGVDLILATQRPDAKSLPTGVSANMGTRFCLRVMGQMENDMILGTSMYRNGVRATMFVKKDKGVGYLVGAADDAQITRTYYVDGPTADKICDRARALRVANGTLAGQAAGLAPATTAGSGFDLLADILSVVPATEAKVWNENVVAALAELRPEVYGGWKSEQLTAALKPHGIATSRQVWGNDSESGKGANRKGIHRDDITAAVTQRDRKKDAA